MKALSDKAEEYVKGNNIEDAKCYYRYKEEDVKEAVQELILRLSRNENMDLDTQNEFLEDIKEIFGEELCNSRQTKPKVSLRPIEKHVIQSSADNDNLIVRDKTADTLNKEKSQ